MLVTPVLRTRTLSAADFRCQAQPGKRAVPALHDRDALAYVRKGSFGFRLAARGNRAALPERLAATA